MAHCKGTINGDDDDGSDSDMLIILLFHLKLALKNLSEKSQVYFLKSFSGPWIHAAWYTLLP